MACNAIEAACQLTTNDFNTLPISYWPIRDWWSAHRNIRPYHIHRIAWQCSACYLFSQHYQCAITILVVPTWERANELLIAAETAIWREREGIILSYISVSGYHLRLATHRYTHAMDMDTSVDIIPHSTPSTWEVYWLQPTNCYYP